MHGLIEKLLCQFKKMLNSYKVFEYIDTLLKH